MYKERLAMAQKYLVDEIREKIGEMVISGDFTISDIHKETGVARETITNFLKGTNSSVRTVLLLNKFVDAQEEKDEAVYIVENMQEEKDETDK